MKTENNTHTRPESHKLIYETAPEFWQDGFPIGNGHFGGLAYQPDGAVLEIAVSKLDVWKRNIKTRPFVAFDRIRKLAANDPEQLNRELRAEFAPAEEAEFACFKPCGRLRIALDYWAIDPSASIFYKRQELSLEQGLVRGSYELSGKAMSHETVVDPEENIIVVSLHDTWLHPGLKFPYSQNIKLYRLPDPEAGTIKTYFSEGIAYIEFDFKEDFKSIIAFKVSGSDTKSPIRDSHSVSLDVMLDYAEKSPKDYTVYLTVVTSSDEPGDLQEAAKRKLLKAEQRGFASIKQRAADFWRQFWDQSSVRFGNLSLESLWYFSLYQFAASSRGNTAPGLFGLWNAERSAPWNGDYHGDINMAMTYWPIFAINHLELGEPFFKTFDKIAETAIQHTREVYRIDGLKFPIATCETGEEMTPGNYRMMQCTSAFYALLYWNSYLYSQDKNLLKERIFHILEECSKFYLAISEEQADGSLLIGPSWSPEQGPCPAWNVNNDLGLIKPLWEAYLKACDELAISTKYIKQVKRALEIFPEYPQKEGEFSDSLTANDFTELNHPGLLAMVVPGNDVDADSDLAPVALKSLHNYLKHTNRKSFSDRLSSACDLTWVWLLAVAVRLRDTEYAEHILMDIGIAEYLKPNGMFGFLGGGFFKSIEEKRKAYNVKESAIHALLGLSNSFRGRELTMSMLQQASGFLFAVNEMLLQSHNGIIRIFPAVAECLGANCSFDNFRTEGAFLVSAQRNNKLTSSIKITSITGTTCKLRIYDIPDYKKLILKNSCSNMVEAERSELNTWSFKTQVGISYYWQRDWDAKENISEPVPASEIRQFICGNKKNKVKYGKEGALFQRF